LSAIEPYVLSWNSSFWSFLISLGFGLYGQFGALLMGEAIYALVLSFLLKQEISAKFWIKKMIKEIFWIASYGLWVFGAFIFEN